MILKKCFFQLIVIRLTGFLILFQLIQTPHQQPCLIYLLFLILPKQAEMFYHQFEANGLHRFQIHTDYRSFLARPYLAILALQVYSREIDTAVFPQVLRQHHYHWDCLLVEEVQLLSIQLIQYRLLP